MSGLESLPLLAIDPTRPWAVLADLHSNLEALAVVDAWLRQQGVDQAIVLGDLVGYGPSPLEVLEIVRYRGWPCLRGNHEELVLGVAAESMALKRRALAAAAWTRPQLNGRELGALGALPSIARIGEDALAVHGSLVERSHCHAYLYDLSLDLNVRALVEMAPPWGSLVLHGHTHRAALFATNGRDWEAIEISPAPVSLERDHWYFVNPGSVGYPRDGDPRASFMVWDPGSRRLHLHRLAYDVAATAGRIRAAGYCDEMAERLLAAR